MRLDKLKVLIIDDNATMRRLITTILRSLNIRNTLEAADGAEALSMLWRWPPDLMLVDYAMGAVNGSQFIRQVRRDYDPGGGPALPIILVTGHADLACLQEAKAAGATDVIAKPFTTKALMQKIMRAVPLEPG